MGRIRAQCLIIDGLKVLMVNQAHDGRNYWCLPGGGLNEGETPEQAAIRELKEECGLDALELRKVSTIHYDVDDEHHTFLVTEYTGDIATGHDPEFAAHQQIIQGVGWRHVDELSRLDFALVAAGGLVTNRQAFLHLGEFHA